LFKDGLDKIKVVREEFEEKKIRKTLEAVRKLKLFDRSWCV